MNKAGPIVVIEDDMDDQAVLVEIFSELGYENEIIYFIDGEEALHYLNRTDVQPFLILSDINMPKINGFELRSKIFTNEQLQTTRMSSFKRSVFPICFLPQVEQRRLSLTLMQCRYRDFS